MVGKRRMLLKESLMVLGDLKDKETNRTRMPRGL